MSEIDLNDAIERVGEALDLVRGVPSIKDDPRIDSLVIKANNILYELDNRLHNVHDGNRPRP